jgi:hypothetical protein
MQAQCFLSTSRGRAETTGHAQPRNPRSALLLSGHAEVLCRALPQCIASSHRIREGRLRLPSGIPNIRQPVTSSSFFLRNSIPFPPALIPRILNDSVSFRKSRDGILLSLLLTTSISPCLRKFFRERPPPEPSHLPCDCHERRPLAQEFREAVRGFAWGLLLDHAAQTKPSI